MDYTSSAWPFQFHNWFIILLRHFCKTIYTFHARFSGLVKSYGECTAREAAEASGRLPHARKNSSVLRVVKLLNQHGKKPKEARKKYFTTKFIFVRR